MKTPEEIEVERLAAELLRQAAVLMDAATTVLTETGLSLLYKVRVVEATVEALDDRLTEMRSRVQACTGLPPRVWVEGCPDTDSN